jgi:hypothetical protein
MLEEKIDEGNDAKWHSMVEKENNGFDIRREDEADNENHSSDSTKKEVLHKKIDSIENKRELGLDPACVSKRLLVYDQEDTPVVDMKPNYPVQTNRTSRDRVSVHSIRDLGTPSGPAKKLEKRSGRRKLRRGGRRSGRRSSKRRKKKEGKLPAEESTDTMDTTDTTVGPRKAEGDKNQCRVNWKKSFEALLDEHKTLLRTQATSLLYLKEMKNEIEISHEYSRQVEAELEEAKARLDVLESSITVNMSNVALAAAERAKAALNTDALLEKSAIAASQLGEKSAAAALAAAERAKVLTENTLKKGAEAVATLQDSLKVATLPVDPTKEGEGRGAKKKRATQIEDSVHTSVAAEFLEFLL